MARLGRSPIRHARLRGPRQAIAAMFGPPGPRTSTAATESNVPEHRLRPIGHGGGRRASAMSPARSWCGPGGNKRRRWRQARERGRRCRCHWRTNGTQCFGGPAAAAESGWGVTKDLAAVRDRHQPRRGSAVALLGWGSPAVSPSAAPYPRLTAATTAVGRADSPATWTLQPCPQPGRPSRPEPAVGTHARRATRPGSSPFWA